MTEILHPGLLDVLECAHKEAQGAIVPDLLVSVPFSKWQIKTYFFLMHCPYLSFGQRQGLKTYHTLEKIGEDCVAPCPPWTRR